MNELRDRDGRTEAEFLADYDMGRFPATAVTVDMVVLTIRNGALSVLLVQRGAHPFLGAWALPGGFKDPGESLGDAALREPAEETGLGSDVIEGVFVEQLGSYGDPGRDPRGHVVSVAYVAFLPDLPLPTAGSDADAARWWAIDDLALSVAGADTTGAGPSLAFDHAQIIAAGVERARAKLEYSTAAASFVAEPFTISELRRVYEATWGVALNAGNFWRKVLATDGFVVPTGDTQVRDRGKPSALYVRGPAVWLTPPITRPPVPR